MPKKKFTPILGDLNNVLTTDKQKEDYVLAACEFLEVPPELGLVVLQLMDAGDGARQLLLYCRKGATDIIRERKKISIDSLEPFNGEGYVGFLASGHDPSGRKEMAVGTVSIKGLTGQAVANCVMTAQTKAMRRLTLQFAGGGFLDETEINEKTTNIANAASSLKEIAQPSVAQPSVQINAAPGRDTTTTTTSPATAPPVQTPKPEPPQEVALATEERKRKRKNVSLDVLEANDPARGIGKMCTYEQVGPSDFVPVYSEPTESEKLQQQLEPISELKPIVNSCTKEQKDEFRKRFSEYCNIILPPAGFLQSEKLGSRNDKLKLFAQKMFPNADVRNLSTEQWTHFFSFLDQRKDKPQELVKFINEKIGEEV